MIKALEVHAGDIVLINDWQLHVNVVVPPEAPAQVVSIAYAEFDFLVHYQAMQLLDVRRP